MNRYVSLYKVADPGRVYRSQNQRIKHFPVSLSCEGTLFLLKYCIIQILAPGTIYSGNTMYISMLYFKLEEKSIISAVGIRIT